MTVASLIAALINYQNEYPELENVPVSIHVRTGKRSYEIGSIFSLGCAADDSDKMNTFHITTSIFLEP